MVSKNLNRCSSGVYISNYIILIFAILSIFFAPSLLYTAYAEKKFYSIQVAAFKKLDDAVNMADGLKSRGHNAFYRYETVKGKGKWYRVYLEKFGSKGDAQKEAKRLMEQNLISDYIIRMLVDEKKSVLKNAIEKEKDVEKTAPPLVIKNITYKIEEGNKEIVFIHCNRFINPPVFVIEGERPRSVIDIKETIAFRGELSKISVNGELIKQVRTHLYPDTRILRVVLDHYASKNYIVSKFFYKKENIYALEVVEKKVTEPIEEREIEKVEEEIGPTEERDAEEVRGETEPIEERDAEEVEGETEPIEEREVGKVEENTEPEKKRDIKRTEKKVNRDAQMQVAYIPEDIEQEKIELRRIGEDLTEEDVRAMLLKYDFYSSCWTYNSDFCNPYGGLDNFFIDNGDGTVADRATNLMWQKGGSSKVMTWREAKEYVQHLNHQSFAGFSDWRLPTVEELASVMEQSWENEDLFIDKVFDKKQKSCWSADTHGSEMAWKSNFHLGFITDAPQTDKNSVRAVR